MGSQLDVEIQNWGSAQNCASSCSKKIRSRKSFKKWNTLHKNLLSLIVLVLSTSYTTSAVCIALENSSQCSAFSKEMIDTTVPDYPFMSDVFDTTTFDVALKMYANTKFQEQKYKEQFSCPNYTKNSNSQYNARFTTTILCAAIVQKSRAQCSRGSADVQTVCATTCAMYAESEATILGSPECGLVLTDQVVDQVRQDYNLCSTPARAYAGPTCVEGSQNEPSNCGFTDNTAQLCNFCNLSRTNGTESCCHTIPPTMCAGIVITDTRPSISVVPPLAAPEDKQTPLLSIGVIAAITASVLSLCLLASCLVLCACYRRRREQSLRHRLQTLNQSGDVYRPFSGVLQDSSPPAMSSSSVTRQQPALSLSRNRSAIRPGSTTSKSHGQPDDEGPDSCTKMTLTGSITQAQRSSSSNQVTSLIDSDTSDSETSVQAFTDQYTGNLISIGSTVSCIHDYDPALPDEMRLCIGDRIRITDIYDDSWCRGTKLDSRSAEFGMFPGICISSGDQSIHDSENLVNPTSEPVTSTAQDDALQPVLEEQEEEQQQHRKVLIPRGSTSKFKEHVNTPESAYF